MTKVCVITGGGSGMGLEVAKLMDPETKVIISGRTVAKLEGAISQLKEAGIDAEPYSCDVSDRTSVEELAAFAASRGTVTTVIHAAGISPHMGDGLKIFAINAVGTMNVDEVFGKIIADGGVILNVSSMSAYMLPADRVPLPLYRASAFGAQAFLGGCQQLLAQVPAEMATGMAYTISKNFVLWYTKQQALQLGKRGVRVVSISPGTFATPMGEAEGEEAAKFALNGALGRLGDPTEIAQMMAFMVSDKASYLTAADVLYDGGAVAAFQEAQLVQAAKGAANDSNEGAERV